jgi:hypothetical protein
VEPGTVSPPLTEICYGGEVVGLAGVDLSRVGDDDHRSIEASEFGLKCGEIDPAIGCCDSPNGLASKSEGAK